MQIETLKWTGDTDGYLELIDQRKLPNHYEKLQCKTPEQLFEAIQTLAVRGAPAIGVSAAYGVCIVIQSVSDSDAVANALKVVLKGCEYLATSRPTAVNLFWALDRMRQTAAQGGFDSVKALKTALLEQAHAICLQDQQMCQAIGDHGQSLIPDGGAVLTHCNAGALATAGIGTALAPMYVAHAQGKRFKVYVDETRPLLQGARLTAWELTEAGLDATLICDNMSATLMQAGKIDAIITGADRIAANGDAANKIGTLALSILAKHYQIPFYIAAPSSTFDMAIADGSQIPIEQRKSEEICQIGQTCIAPKSMNAYNPAFDVTSADDITAIVTESGLIQAPNRAKITSFFEKTGIRDV